MNIHSMIKVVIKYIFLKYRLKKLDVITVGMHLIQMKIGQLMVKMEYCFREMTACTGASQFDY